MKFTCTNYPNLKFYVNGAVKRFNNGVYETTDKDEQAVLKRITEVHKVPSRKRGGSK